MIQGSEDWLTFRRNHLGGTDASVITGLNPFKNKITLWEEKTLGWVKTPSPKEIARMAEGTRMEPIARQGFIDSIGIPFEPVVAEHDQYPYISASYDGISPDFQYIVEIKCGMKSFAMAREGLIPDYYTCQMQHQMFVAELDSCFYFCFDGKEGICLEVKREQDFIDKMLEEEIKFWHCVTSFTQPES
jgi:putative phage-type endonuclease